MHRLRKNLIDKNPEKNLACKDCDMPYDKNKNSITNKINSLFNRFQIFR